MRRGRKVRPARRAGVRDDVRSTLERLETRRLLSGVAASTAAGYLPALTVGARQANPAPHHAATGGTASHPLTAVTAKAHGHGRSHKGSPVNQPPTTGGGTTPTAGSAGATPAVAAPDFFPGSVYYPAGSGDYATGHAGHTVGWIVIHTTESTASSTINEFTTPNLQVSANYMVERGGVIDQFVADGNTAYHAGNLAYNESSIGIEHERYTTNGVAFNATEQEYEASATLVRWLASYYGMPLTHLAASVAPADPSTGTGVIGHYQVPDPSNPSLGGGASHHTDPVNWDWTHYMSLITTTTTPLMPVLIGVGSATPGATSVSGTTQTLSWMPAANATSYKVTLIDLTTNTTTTYTPTAASQAVAVVAGHTYAWSAISLKGSTQSISSPVYYFGVGMTATLTDAQKQQQILNMVNNHRGTTLPAEMVLSEIMLEGGQGAFYVNGASKNSFYSSSIQPWCQPQTNTDGIMQVTSASGYAAHAPYSNTMSSYDDSITDGTADLKAGYSSYGTLWQASLHYNTGPNSLYIYENGMGDKTYLSDIAARLSTVATLYGIQDPALISKYNAGQAIVNSFLNNGSILSGQSVSYYASYQTQLDAQLHALGAADDAPAMPTNVAPVNGLGGVSTAPTLSASAYSDPNAGDGQSAAEWVIKRVSDGAIVYDSGTDTAHKTSLPVPSGKLLTGTQYSWQVRYADTEGMWSNYSTPTTFTTVDVPPTITSLGLSPDPVVQGLSVLATASGVSDADGSVASVQFWAEANGVAGLQTGAGGDTLYTVAPASPYSSALLTGNLPLGVQTFYAVAVDNLGATSAPVSASVTIRPVATSVTATAAGGRSVHITWDGGTPGPDGFAVERSTGGDGGGAFVTIAQLPSTASSYDDTTGLQPGTTYTYRLRAAFRSAQSSPVASNATSTWIMGDADGDGSATFNDFLILQNNYDAPGGWTQGDFDGNGFVDVNDFLILQNAMG